MSESTDIAELLPTGLADEQRHSPVSDHNV